MQIMRVSKEILALGDFSNGTREDDPDKTPTCRWATPEEELRIQHCKVEGDVCFLSSDGLLLMERVGEGNVGVPIIRRNGERPDWKMAMANQLTRQKLMHYNPPCEDSVTVRVHGKLYGSWYYECAWFKI